MSLLGKVDGVRVDYVEHLTIKVRVNSIVAKVSASYNIVMTGKPIGLLLALTYAK
jgi:hypothetical protein